MGSFINPSPQPGMLLALRRSPGMRTTNWRNSQLCSWRLHAHFPASGTDGSSSPGAIVSYGGGRRAGCIRMPRPRARVHPSFSPISTMEASLRLLPAFAGARSVLVRLIPSSVTSSESKGVQQLWSATTTPCQRGLSVECSLLRFAVPDTCRSWPPFVFRFFGFSSWLPRAVTFRRLQVMLPRIEKL